MSDLSAAQNPFMLMLNPEVVIAAMEKSEALARLSSRLCRPLDRMSPPGQSADAAESTDDADEADVSDLGIDGETAEQIRLS